MSQLARHLPETMEALVKFLKSGSTAGLPHRVAVPAPTFRVPSFPPPRE
ncbi:MAG TPA: hypothetical protein VIL46_07910 [Gemmataceae bacterium]